MTESEQYPEVFLPTEEEKLPSKIPQAEKSDPLSAKEKSELTRLAAAEKQREQDLIIYGPAISEINTLLLSADEIEKIIAEGTGKKEKIEDKVKFMMQNISQALSRELEVVDRALMDVREKKKITGELADYLSLIKDAEIKSGLSQKEALKFLLKIFSDKTLARLGEIFNKRFNKLLSDQKKYSDLSMRSIATGEL